jgi:hypothetical protein
MQIREVWRLELQVPSFEPDRNTISFVQLGPSAVVAECLLLMNLGLE